MDQISRKFERMMFTDYLVPYSCYPRCQHAYRYLKNLSDRYDDLKNTSEKPNRNSDQSEFHLCLQTSDKGTVLEIKNVLKRDEEFRCLEKITSENMKNLIPGRGYQNEMYWVLIIKEKVNKDDIPHSDKVKIIIIADDARDRDNALELYKDTQNVHISLKEDVSEEVSNIIEQFVFNAFEMKSKCEQLHKTLNSIVPKGGARLEKCTLPSSEESHLETKHNTLEKSSSRKRSASFQSGCHKDNIVRSSKQYRLEGATLTAELSLKPEAVRQKQSKGINMSLESENELHSVVKNMDESKDVLQKQDIEKSERLYDEIMGMYSRSRVPKNERPQLDKPFDGTVNETLKDGLRRLSPYIRSCGYRYRSFVVFVDEKFNPESSKPGLEKIMKEHNIHTFTIVPHSVQQFSSCNVGSKIEAEFANGDIKIGTLGGFGLASSDKEGKTGDVGLASPDKERKTIGLVSRHVVTIGNIPASSLRVWGEEQSTTASVLLNNSFSDRDNVLDIAAASFGHNNDSLNSRYKTSEERAAKGRLSDYKPEEMQGLPVHICGSTTSLGYGTVTMPKIEAIRDKYMDENFIIIEDRENPGTEKKAFCKEGDSGAIVCADDLENPEEVHLISMVMGENTGKPGCYYSLNLKNGIQQVEEETKSNIKLL